MCWGELYGKSYVGLYANGSGRDSSRVILRQYLETVLELDTTRGFGDVDMIILLIEGKYSMYAAPP